MTYRSFCARSAVLVLFAGLAPTIAAAQDLGGDPGLFFVPIAEGAVRVDGSLRDWRETPLHRVGGSASSRMGYALGYDGIGLFVAASVDDERLVRTRAGGPTDDAVVLTLASDDGRGGFVVTEVWLHPGVEGSQQGLVLAGRPGRHPRPVRGARIVELLRGRSGYNLEAYLPIAAIPGARDWQRGRGAIRFHDVDQAGRGRPTVSATAELGEGGAASLPVVKGAGGELGSLASFLRDRGLDRGRVQFDLRGDVAGDSRPERVVLAGGLAATMGPGYRDGVSYDFSGLGELAGRGVVSAELAELTGDGKEELLVRTESRGSEGLRTIASVYTFARGRIELLWAAVIGVRNPNGRVEGRLEVKPARRGAPELVLHAGEAEGLDSTNFRASEGGDEVPLLLPWGPIAARAYRFDRGRFVPVGEAPNPHYRAPEPAPPTRAEGSAPVGAAQARPSARPAEVRGPSVAQLIEAVKRERGLHGRARFRSQANLAEDPRPETLLVFGRSLVVVGPGFRGGRGYFFFELPAQAPGDLVDVFTADVTGDGRDEIFCRIRQDLGQGFEREVLVVHRFTPRAFPRALAVEVMRTDGTHRIENRVRTKRGGGRRILEIEPGRAMGWNRSSWPFSGFADDGVAPLLLPWQDEPRSYCLDRGTLVPRQHE